MDIKPLTSGPFLGELKGRRLKQQVEHLLKTEPFPPALSRLLQIPPRRVVGPLFSFLYHGQSLLRWRAVSAMGEVVARQAEKDLPSARIVMRRLMWNLNDESGGMGWGSPEAMGDILARSPSLAREYNRILISYLNPEGNFLEHPGLQQGVLWGVGRLLRIRPEIGNDSAPLLRPFLQAPDAPRRGLAVWAIVPLDSKTFYKPLEALTRDESVVKIYEESSLAEKRIKDLAREALRNLSPPGNRKC